MQTSAWVLNEATLLSSPWAPVTVCDWWESRSWGGEGTPKPQLRYWSHTSSTCLFSYHSFHSFSLLGPGTPVGQAPPKTPSQTPESPIPLPLESQHKDPAFCPWSCIDTQPLRLSLRDGSPHSNSICLWTLARPKELQRHHSSWKGQRQPSFLCYLSQ